jgi:hypothetical protein
MIWSRVLAVTLFTLPYTALVVFVNHRRLAWMQSDAEGFLEAQREHLSHSAPVYFVVITIECLIIVGTIEWLANRVTEFFSAGEPKDSR